MIRTIQTPRHTFWKHLRHARFSLSWSWDDIVQKLLQLASVVEIQWYNSLLQLFFNFKQGVPLNCRQRSNDSWVLTVTALRAMAPRKGWLLPESRSYAPWNDLREGCNLQLLVGLCGQRLLYLAHKIYIQESYPLNRISLSKLYVLLCAFFSTKAMKEKALIYISVHFAFALSMGRLLPWSR